MPSPVVMKTSHMSSPPKQRLDTKFAGTFSVLSSDPSAVKRTTFPASPVATHIPPSSSTARPSADPSAISANVRGEVSDPSPAMSQASTHLRA